MNIIFLEAVQDHGGARKSTIELAKRLDSETGINTLIVDFYGSNKDFIKDVEQNMVQCRILDKRDQPFIIQDKNKLKELSNYLTFFAERKKLQNKLHKIIDDFKPDFFIVNNSKTLSLIPESANYRKVLFARGWFIPSQISVKDKFVYKKADLFMAVSQSTRQALFSGKMAPLDKIYVVKNGIDLNNPFFKEPKKENETLTIIHSGSFIAEKGHHITIGVSKKLKELGIPHKIYLTGKVHQADGSPEYFREIKKQIADFQLEDYIEIIANTNNILPYMKEADLFLHPSDTEGLPRVIMEAMALKTLVIANAVGGVTDYVLDGFTGFIADFNNIHHYVELIQDVLNHPERKKQIVENAYALIQDCYSPDSQVNEMKRILNENMKS